MRSAQLDASAVAEPTEEQTKASKEEISVLLEAQSAVQPGVETE